MDEIEYTTYNCEGCGAAVVRVPAWVPVCEKLPEPYTSVLVFCVASEDDKATTQCTAWLRNDGKWVEWGSNGEALDDPELDWIVTHWMILPDPPTE